MAKLVIKSMKNSDEKKPDLSAWSKNSEQEPLNKKTREQLLAEVVQKCEVVLYGDVISKEQIYEIASRYLADSVKDTHTSTIFLHTGSVVYDAVAFVLAIFINIIFDDNSVEDEAETLEVGSVVSYEGEKKNTLYIYKGPAASYEGMIELQEVKDPTGRRFISQNSLGKLLPYHGNASDIKGRGVRISKSKRMEFQSEILGLEPDQVVATPKLSTVVMIDHERLDFLLETVQLRFPEKDKEYSLLDLATVTYYTDTREFRKKGNASNNEPAIKATSSIERARELIISGDQNTVIGFVALTPKSYKRGLNEFESLFRRKKLRYCWLVTPIEKNKMIEAQLDSDNEILALTPNLLKNQKIDFTPDNDTSLALYKEIQSVAYRRSNYAIVPSSYSWKDYKKVRMAIKYILDNCGEDVNATQFSRWAFSMLKLYNFAFFNLNEYDEYLSKTGFETKRESIDKQKAVIPLLTDYLQNKANEIIEYIEKIYTDLYDKNPKKDYIKKYVFDKGYNRIAFIVPSRNYEKVGDDYIKKNMRFRRFKYTVLTEAQIKNVSLSQYDCVIFPALLNYEAINPYSLMSANEVVIFVYDTQIRLCKFLEREFNSFIRNLEEKCPEYLYKPEPEEEQIEEEKQEIAVWESEIGEEQAIDDTFRNMFLQTERFQSREYFGGENTREKGIEVCRYAQCDTGEKILFSKGYCAYAINSIKGEVVEKPVEAIENGDQLIFTINDDKTKDIVDELLVELCERNDDINNGYNLVKRWKEDFRELKDSNDWTYVDIVKMFNKAGCDVTAQTIRQWIDEDSHIVGPKEKEMFIYIGRVLCDKEVEENYQKYAEATQVVRRIRTRILKLIQSVVVDDLNGSKQIEEKMFADMIDEIRKIATIKQIEHIENIEPFKISINRANRPLDM